jgi:AcrR family transcriptional regulator
VPGPGKIPYKARMKPAERRVLIERAAAGLFAECGYEAASLEEIARAAGITKRVLYYHFESKRDLHITLLRRTGEDLLAAMRTRVAVANRPRDQLVEAMTAFFEFVEHDRYAWRMLFRDPPSDPVVVAAHREVQRTATVAIAAMMAAFTEDMPATRLEMHAEHLKAGVNGLASWWYENPGVPREEIVAAAVDLAWNGLAVILEGRRPATERSTRARGRRPST